MGDMKRQAVAVRLEPELLARLDVVAGQFHEGNRSLALRAIIRSALTSTEQNRTLNLTPAEVTLRTTPMLTGSSVSASFSADGTWTGGDMLKCSACGFAHPEDVRGWPENLRRIVADNHRGEVNDTIPAVLTAGEMVLTREQVASPPPRCVHQVDPKKMRCARCNLTVAQIRAQG